MTQESFVNKWHIKRKSDMILNALDILYLEYSKEEILALVSDFYDHADEIYNSTIKIDKD